jgi:hypothetical protein
LGIAKKRVSIFDEQSHYVIENKDSGLRTKPNKPNFSHSNLGENRMGQAGAPAGQSRPATGTVGGQFAGVAAGLSRHVEHAQLKMAA